MNNLFKTIVIALLVIIVGLVLFKDKDEGFLGNIADGQAYNATTTTTGTWTTLVPQTLKTGSGALGSVTITGAAAGVISIYDATTTNVNLRTGNKATSSIIVASIPASTAAGTYTFDVTYNTALLVELVGSIPTTTITWR